MDQATTLREAVLSHMRSQGEPSRQVATVVFVSGKGGVGTSSLVVNAATALASIGRRLCVLDPDPLRFDTGRYVGLDIPTMSAWPIGEWPALASPTASGFHIVSLRAVQSADQSSVCHHEERRIQELFRASHPYQGIVIDVGSQDPRIQRAWCKRATQIVFVTTPDAVSVFDTYALLKHMIPTVSTAKLGLVINQSSHPDESQAIADRLTASVDRFLGRRVSHLGTVPFDTRFHEAGSASQPLVQRFPTSEVANALQTLVSGIPFPEASNGVPVPGSRTHRMDP